MLDRTVNFFNLDNDLASESKCSKTLTLNLYLAVYSEFWNSRRYLIGFNKL